MKAEEYLSSAWKLKLSIENLTEVLAFLKSSAECQSPRLSSIPCSRSHNPHKTEDSIIKLLELEEKLEGERKCLSDVMSTISGISDPVLQAIVIKRYVERKTWDSISSDLHISLTHLRRLHNTVLTEIDTVLKDGQKWT